MPKFNRDWKVGPHGPVETLDDGLLTVAGEITMPLGRFPRRMTIVGLTDNRTAIWSAMPLREDAMRPVEALGAPAFLIVPGIGHRLDLKPWKERYPDAKVVCAPGARKAVEQVVPVDATADVLGDPSVRFEAVPGTGGKEAALVVRRRKGATLIVNDILANVRDPHGVGAWIMARLMGFGVDRPRIPWVGKRLFVDDAKALAVAFRTWAKEPELAQIVVSHGDVIHEQPKALLERLADDLDG